MLCAALVKHPHLKHTNYCHEWIWTDTKTRAHTSATERLRWMASRSRIVTSTSDVRSLWIVILSDPNTSSQPPLTRLDPWINVDCHKWSGIHPIRTAFTKCTELFSNITHTHTRNFPKTTTAVHSGFCLSNGYIRVDMPYITLLVAAHTYAEVEVGRHRTMRLMWHKVFCKCLSSNWSRHYWDTHAHTHAHDIGRKKCYFWNWVVVLCFVVFCHPFFDIRRYRLHTILFIMVWHIATDDRNKAHMRTYKTRRKAKKHWYANDSWSKQIVLQSGNKRIPNTYEHDSHVCW